MNYRNSLLATIFLAFSSAAVADTSTVSWTDPTTNTDGTAIPATGPGSIALRRVEYGSCNGTAFGTRSGEVVVLTPGPAIIQNLSRATTYCYRVFVTNTYGAESAASNVVAKTTTIPVPNPAVLTTVSTVAYVIKPGAFGVLRLAKVKGVVLSVGTPCDAALPGLPGLGVQGPYIARCGAG
jgi:hypothetical protein